MRRMRIISSPIPRWVEAARGRRSQTRAVQDESCGGGVREESVRDGAAAIKKKGDKGLNDLVVDPFANQQTRVSDMAWGLLEHSGEHYGNWWCITRCRIGAAESRPKK